MIFHIFLIIDKSHEKTKTSLIYFIPLLNSFFVFKKLLEAHKSASLEDKFLHYDEHKCLTENSPNESTIYRKEKMDYSSIILF